MEAEIRCGRAGSAQRQRNDARYDQCCGGHALFHVTLVEQAHTEEGGHHHRQFASWSDMRDRGLLQRGQYQDVVVTFTSGGAPDIIGRILAERFTAAWNQPVLVDNKPGSGGNIGADFVAKSAPDGHTLVVGTVGTHSINGALYPKMPYDMVRDFVPVSLVATTPNLLVVNNEVPAKSVKELIDLGKKTPLTFASSGSNIMN